MRVIRARPAQPQAHLSHRETFPARVAVVLTSACCAYGLNPYGHSRWDIKSNSSGSFLPCSFSFPNKASVPRVLDRKRGFSMRAREEGYQLVRIT